MTGCRLCFRDENADRFNEPLFESENFVAIASLGALVEGWFLLLPKDHYVCLGALPQSLLDEMMQLKRAVLSFAEPTYGDICAFEHGPRAENRSVGCGVGHAHLHLVPCSFDLLSAVQPFLPRDTIWKPATSTDCAVAFSEYQDYLYLEQPIGRGSIARHDQFSGQLFRRAIATRLGLSTDYNWRDFPQIQNVEATMARVLMWNETRRCQTTVTAAA
jgi:ATP adenylyltransferase